MNYDELILHFYARSLMLFKQIRDMQSGSPQTRITIKTLRENLFYLQGLDTNGKHKDFIRDCATITKQH